MKKIATIVFALVSILSFGQGITTKCAVCPPTLSGVPDGYVLTDSSGVPRWQAPVGGSIDTNRFWNIGGNTDITDANFLGTTNTDSLRFQLNGNPWGCLDNANYSVSIGAYAGEGSSGNGNGVMIGYAAGQNGAGASFNIGVGYQALSTATGANSIGIGFNAGYNSSGDNKIFLGTNSGIANTGSNVFAAQSFASEGNTGSNVIAIGDSAAQSNTGNHVIAIGKNAGKNNTLDNILIVSDTIKNLKLPLGTDSIPCYNCVLVNDSTGNASWQQHTSKVDLTNQTASITTTNISGTDSAGFYLLDFYLVNSVADGTAGNVTITITWNDGVAARTITSSALALTSNGFINHVTGATTENAIYKNGSGPIQFSTTATTVNSAAYDLHIRVEDGN